MPRNDKEINILQKYLEEYRRHARVFDELEATHFHPT
jgi:hypothetical protein